MMPRMSLHVQLFQIVIVTGDPESHHASSTKSGSEFDLLLLIVLSTTARAAWFCNAPSFKHAGLQAVRYLCHARGTVGDLEAMAAPHDGHR